MVQRHWTQALGGSPAHKTDCQVTRHLPPAIRRPRPPPSFPAVMAGVEAATPQRVKRVLEWTQSGDVKQVPGGRHGDHHRTVDTAPAAASADHLAAAAAAAATVAIAPQQRRMPPRQVRIEARDPVVVVGGGPAGCLTALELGRRGLSVELYEYRYARARDRTQSGDVSSRRSINLALSRRGLDALAGVGLASRVHAIGVRMRGRMIHDRRGRRTYQAYGSRPDEYLLSVSRQELNELLLDACELEPSNNISVFLGKKFVDADLDCGVVVFEDAHRSSEACDSGLTPGVRRSSSAARRQRRWRRRRQRPVRCQPEGTERTAAVLADADADADTIANDYSHSRPSAPRREEDAWADEQACASIRSTPARMVCTRHVTAGFVVGADGAFSKVRAVMQRAGWFDYAQEYLPTSYKELRMPAKRTSPGKHSLNMETRARYAMEPHCLHIWPRDSFMLIALPNRDGSFTCTLFLNAFANPQAPRAPCFEQLQTPADVRAFFAHHFPDALPLMPTLVEDFFATPASPLFTVRCAPFHYGNRAVLLGDAAHAIVPFYGQGCNAALEDARVLGELFDAEIERAVKAATTTTTIARSAERSPGSADEAVETDIALRLPDSSMNAADDDDWSDGDESIDSESGIRTGRSRSAPPKRETPTGERPSTDLPSSSSAASPPPPSHSRSATQPTSVPDGVLDVARVLAAYTAARKPDADAIAQLALDNYTEMASKTASPAFRLRRRLENGLHALMPSRFMSLYHMVSFSHIPYAESVRRARRQERVLSALVQALLAGGTAAGGYALWLTCKRLRQPALATLNRAATE